MRHRRYIDDLWGDEACPYAVGLGAMISGELSYARKLLGFPESY